MLLLRTTTIRERATPCVVPTLCILLACGGSPTERPPTDGPDAGAPQPSPDGGGASPDGGPGEPRPDGSVAGGDAGQAPACVNLTVFADPDGDAYGTSSVSEQACLLPDEEITGYARRTGDCGPQDPWRNPAAEEICGDYVDDDCASGDQSCPTTQQAGLDVPSWNCVNGAPPSNVYAWALFPDGGPYFLPNACFVFFEGLPDEFYVQRVNLVRANTSASCDTTAGCTCPSSPSYDRRLYAFTLRGTVSTCAELTIIDHGGETQPVSNDCRKYLYQLHYPAQPPPPYSYISGDIASLDRRLTLFPTVEVACAGNPPNSFLPFASLMTASIQKNSGFVKK